MALTLLNSWIETNNNKIYYIYNVHSELSSVSELITYLSNILPKDDMQFIKIEISNNDKNTFNIKLTNKSVQAAIAIILQ